MFLKNMPLVCFSSNYLLELLLFEKKKKKKKKIQFASLRKRTDKTINGGMNNLHRIKETPCEINKSINEKDNLLN